MNTTLSFEMLLKIGAFLVSIVLLLKGILEYKKAQNWKKSEFVSKEIKELLNDFEIKRALVLLDWNANNLSLADNEIENLKYFYFTDELIYNSLKTHRELSNFSDKEVVIKKIFDNFFDRIGWFDIYIQTGLIETKDIKPYLIYWINIIADETNERKDNDLREQMWRYIKEYNYIDFISICKKFGFHIR